MKGTGTEKDPFILQTADDLYEMETLGGSGIYCRLEADIDLNDTPYAENFVPIPVNWSSFDGGGHKIRNICASVQRNRVNAFAVMVSGNINISGLMLENAIMQGSVVNLFKAADEVSAAIKLHDCTFILKISHTSESYVTGENCMLHGSNLTVSSDLCAIAVSGALRRGYSLFNGGSVKRTQVVLDLVTHDAGNSSVYESSIFRSVNVSDSWITGSIICDASGTNHEFNMADWECTFANCYQAVAMNSITSVFWSNAFSSTCFYDNDLMAGAIYDSRDDKSRLFYGLTTAQCKDPEYLTSIGFICGGDGDDV